jgi:catechol 2,3-dioxygenase-like lactoylglutathione lyase family enzyme
MITGLKFVAVPTRDYDAALAFWTEAMGFALLADRPVPEGRWIELAIPGYATKIVLFTPDGQQDRVGTFFNGAFACDDVYTAHAELSARGVRFESAPRATPWANVVRFSDPDGNMFVLLSDPPAHHLHNHDERLDTMDV